MSRWRLGIHQSTRTAIVYLLSAWEIDPAQPRIAASLLSQFRHYTNLGKCKERLLRLLGEFRFGTTRDGLVQLGLPFGPARHAVKTVITLGLLGLAMELLQPFDWKNSQPGIDSRWIWLSRFRCRCHGARQPLGQIVFPRYAGAPLGCWPTREAVRSANSRAGKSSGQMDCYD